MNRVLMTATSKHIGRNGVLGLLDDLDAGGCTWSALISAGTLVERESAYRLLEPELEQPIATQIIEVVGKSDTGAAVFVSTERIVAIQPPVPLTTLTSSASECVDRSRFGNCWDRVRSLVLSMLRLGRYAVGVLRGDKLLATKTDSRYMKNRHRAGGQSQRRFARSRERLIRELYDKTCDVTRSVFEPYLERVGICDAWRRARHAGRVREALPPDARSGVQNFGATTLSSPAEPEGAGRHFI